MHKVNRLLVAVVSWYNFKLIWLHRSLVSKTIKRKIRPTLTGKVKKQGTPAIATLHNIPINNKLNLHYLLLGLRHHLLQKTNDITLVQNIFYFLNTQRRCVWPGYFSGKYFYLYTIEPWRRLIGVCALPTLEIGAAQLCFVTGMAPKTSFLCMKWSPIRYGFRAIWFLSQKNSRNLSNPVFMIVRKIQL